MEKDILKEIVQVIDSNKSVDEIKELLDNYHDNDIAQVIHDLPKEERIKVYKILGIERLSNVFSYLDDVEDYIDELPVEDAADIIELMDADDAVDVLDELEETDRNKILSCMESDAVADINLINRYDDDEIGSKMTTNFIKVNKNMTIKQVMKSLVMQAAENDNVSTIFAVDDNDSFYGTIDLRDLIIARQDTTLDDIIKTSYPVLLPTVKISECINDLKDYSLDIIPIVNENNKIIGVITSDDVVETVDEELSEDYVKLAGINETEELDESTIMSVKKRIPWLLILLVLGIFISLLISSFENVVKTLPVIIFFQSMILDMSGNSGTQSLAVTIRLLSDERVNRKMLERAIVKETAIGFLNGLILSVISFVAVFAFLYITKTEVVTGDGFSINQTLKVSLVVSISLIVALTLSTLVGCLIPMIFKKIKVDPAVASGPFITTLNDVIAVLLYYGMASIFFMVI